MIVLEWGFNYELHFRNNGNNERIQQIKSGSLTPVLFQICE